MVVSAVAETVKIPGLGPVKKPTAYALGGAAVLVAGIGWYRSRGAAAAGGAAPASGDAGIDPATGFPYGSDQDAAALGQMGAVGGGGPGYGYGGGDGSNTGGGGTGYPQGYTTNSQWSQAAEDYLVNNVHSGENADLIGNALGKYITGQPLSTDQVAIVTQAIAFTGYPPVNGANGYPPSYKTAATPPPAPGPNYKPGKSLPAPGGLHLTNITPTSARVDWNPVSGAASYAVFIAIDPPGGSTPTGVRQGTFAASEMTLQRLKKGTRYRVDVHAQGHDTQIGARARAYFTTKR